MRTLLELNKCHILVKISLELNQERDIIDNFDLKSIVWSSRAFNSLFGS